MRATEKDASRKALGESLADGVIRILQANKRNALEDAKTWLAKLELSLPSTGYRKSIFATAYETKAKAWKETKTYKFLREEERTLENGKKYKCNIYETKGGTLIIEPKNLPKKYHLTVEAIADELEKLPVELKSQAKEIHLLNFYNPNDAHWQKVYKNFTHSYATGGQGTVRFYKCPSYTRQDGIDDLPRVLAHENGHNVDRQLGQTLYKQNISDTKEWKDAMAADLKLSGKKSPTTYGENALAEDFAESCYWLTVHRQQFEKEFQNRCKILKKLFGI